MMGFRKVPLPRSALRCPSVPRAHCIGTAGSAGASAAGSDEAAATGSLVELAPAVTVAPSNNDFRVRRREYFMGRSQALSSGARLYMCGSAPPEPTRPGEATAPNLYKKSALNHCSMGYSPAWRHSSEQAPLAPGAA